MRLALLVLVAALASACASTPEPPDTRGDSISFEVALADTTADADADWGALSEAERARYRAMGDEGLDRPPFPVGGMAGLMANVTYPTEAIREGLEGTVVVEATVAADGTVTTAEAVGPFRPELLAPSAVAAVRQTAFAPAERDGVPVSAVLQVPIVFRLR